MHGMQWWSSVEYFCIHALQGMAGGRRERRGVDMAVVTCPDGLPSKQWVQQPRKTWLLQQYNDGLQLRGFGDASKEARRVPQFATAPAGVIGNIFPAWFSMGFWLQNTVLTVFLDKATDHCCCVCILRNCLTDCLHWHKIIVGFWGFPLPLKMGELCDVVSVCLTSVAERKLVQVFVHLVHVVVQWWWSSLQKTYTQKLLAGTNQVFCQLADVHVWGAKHHL